MQSKVTIYSTRTCPYCKMEKAFLDEHKVAYTEYFVDQDEDRAKEMIQKTGQMAVPVTIIAGPNKEEVIVGFNRQRLAELLGF